MKNKIALEGGETETDLEEGGKNHRGSREEKPVSKNLWGWAYNRHLASTLEDWHGTELDQIPKEWRNIFTFYKSFFTLDDGAAKLDFKPLIIDQY